ncbi:MAG: carbohydrate ABC transporter permease [Propionibacteriaceae bacterium]|jgi:multiple sugar transport system permease protein|nr:carbohydrate ABC transporter permease [Propionibacteriaceae bacterium]
MAAKKNHSDSKYITPISPGSVGMRVGAGVLVALVFLLPYIIMLLGSFKSMAEINRTPPTFIPEEWHLDNYVTMWGVTETPLPDNLLSNIVIAFLATLLTLVVAVPAAYYTAKYRFPGRMAFLFLVLLTQMLQPAVVVVGLFKEFMSLGLGGTWWAMILINSAFNLSFGTWILHSFFASIPKEVDESARLDGASNWQVLWKIDMPLVWPGIVTATIFTFTAAWNEFAASLVILSSDPSKQPLSVALFSFVGQYQTRWQYVFGVSIVAIIPAIILFALIEKKLVAGLTAGSIK